MNAVSSKATVAMFVVAGTLCACTPARDVQDVPAVTIIPNQAPK